MLPEIRAIEATDQLQSVVYLAAAGHFPAGISLTPSEKEYARKQFEISDDIIHINSYIRSVFIVKAREGLPHWRMLEELRTAGAEVAAAANKMKVNDLAILPVTVGSEESFAFAEGMLLSMYRFNRYKTVDHPGDGLFPSIISLRFEGAESCAVRLRLIAEAVWQVRDLINEPVISMHTAAMARAVIVMGEHRGFRTEVLGRSRIEALKMGGLLAVNKGSVDPPAFIIAEWKPEVHVNAKPVVLVGKGVVYDTGGMSLKTGTYMEGMKTDMAGAAAVAGALSVIAGLRLPLHVVGLMPVTDNRVSGNSLVPGDIITMYNGKTVEVLNTDAEGRLIMADALSYSSLYDPDLVISIATLTGSAVVTFGSHASAYMGNAGEEIFSLMEESGMEVYERVARLPFWHEYGDAMKSDFADLKNIDNREGDAIKAGKFLENFVTAPFIHIDIAGPGYIKKDDHYRKKEGPGTGVRLLTTFCEKMVKYYEKQK